MADGSVDIQVRARMDQLERDLREMRRRLGEAGEDAGEDAGDGVASGISGKKAAMVAAGAALGAAAGIGLVNALQNEAANANLAASMGLSPETAAHAGKIAGDLYANNFGDSVETVNSALASLDAANLINIGGPKKDVEDLTGKVLTLVDVFDLDMPKAVNTVGVMLKQGLVRDGQHGVDLLTKSLQMVAPALREDLVDSVNEFSVFFSQLGMTGEETMSALVTASQGGAIALDKVGDMMKEATLKFTDGSATSVDALQTLGHNAEDIGRAVATGGRTAQAAFIDVTQSLMKVEDPLKRTQLGVALFGTQFEDLGQDAIPTLAAMGAGLEGVEGAAKKMVDTVGGTSAAKLETFKRSMEQNVTNVMGKAIGAIEKLPGPMQTVVGTFIGIMPVLAPLTPIFAAFIPMLIGTGAAAGGAGLSLGAMAASLWAVMAPVLAVVAVIAVLVGAVWLIIHHWDTLTAATAAAWDWISGKIETAVGYIIDYWYLLFGPIGLIIHHWDTLKAAAAATWDWITDRVSGFLGFFTGVPGRIAAAARGMWDGIYDAFRSALNSVIGAWNRLGIPGFSIDINLPGPIPDIHFSWGGLSLPDIPLLDSGGIATGPTLAALSGNRKPEAIIPLDRLESMMGLSAGERGGGRGTTIIVQGSLVAQREVFDIINRQQAADRRHNPTPRPFGR